MHFHDRISIFIFCTNFRAVFEVIEINSIHLSFFYCTLQHTGDRDCHGSRNNFLQFVFIFMYNIWKYLELISIFRMVRLIEFNNYGIHFFFKRSSKQVEKVARAGGVFSN